MRKVEPDKRIRGAEIRFNGAALFQVRKGLAFYLDRFFRESLQWGRTLSSAESCSPRRGDNSGLIASMGPHSFKCGKLVDGFLRISAKLKLQWGRTLSSAESSKVFRDAKQWWTKLQWGRTLSSAESIQCPAF